LLFSFKYIQQLVVDWMRSITHSGTPTEKFDHPWLTACSLPSPPFHFCCTRLRSCI
jgi:hypothetical protein